MSLPHFKVVLHHRREAFKILSCGQASKHGWCMPSHNGQHDYLAMQGMVGSIQALSASAYSCRVVKPALLQRPRHAHESHFACQAGQICAGLAGRTEFHCVDQYATFLAPHCTSVRCLSRPFSQQGEESVSGALQDL